MARAQIVADPEDRPAEDSASGPEEPTPQAHRDDGLDLARAAARATAGSTGSPRRSRRPRSGPARDAPTSRRGRTSGAHPDDRDPQPLGDSVARLVDQHGWELDLRVRSVFARWAELVGAEVGEHSTPESFADGRLVVRAHSTAWATQLRLLAPALVRRLCEDLGDATVTVIEVLGPNAPPWTRNRLSTRDTRGPRDTYG